VVEDIFAFAVEPVEAAVVGAVELLDLPAVACGGFTDEAFGLFEAEEPAVSVAGVGAGKAVVLELAGAVLVEVVDEVAGGVGEGDDDPRAGDAAALVEDAVGGLEVLEDITAGDDIEGGVGEGERVAFEVDDDIAGLVDVDAGVEVGAGDGVADEALAAADIEDRAGEDGAVLVGEVEGFGGGVVVVEGVW
jgi:hypothetical protein